jgi:site-specific recombinase XerD
LDLSTIATTADLVAQFLDAKRALARSPRTIEAYQARLNRFTRWLEDRPITRPVLRLYILHLKEQPQLSPISQWAYAHDVGVFCSWLVDEEYLEKNPARKLLPRKPKRLPASYTAAQIGQLLAVCDARDRALIVTLLDTGLRASEVISLDRDDLDWTTGHFTVVGKGNKERSGVVSSYTLGVLCSYFEEREDDEPPLFLGSQGRLSRSGMHQIMLRRAQQAGIRGDVRRLVHGLRVTFAKSYITNGGDLATLAALMGHTSLTMAAHYAQLADAELMTVKARVNPLAAMIAEAGEHLTQ